MATRFMKRMVTVCLVLAVICTFQGVCGNPALAQDDAALVQQLGSTEPAERDAANTALRERGVAAKDALVSGIDDSQTLVRWNSLRLLGELADPTLADRYGEVISSDDYQIVRRAAAIALGKSKAEGAREVLLDFAKTDAVVGAEALGFLGDREALLDVAILMQNAIERFETFLESRGERPGFVRANEGQMAGSIAVIGGALARLESPAAVKPLLESLKYTEWVGMYGRKLMKEYLGDDMPPILPPSTRGPNRDVLATQTALVGFWDLQFDSFVHEDEKLALPQSAIDRCRQMLRDSANDRGDSDGGSLLLAADDVMKVHDIGALMTSLGRPALGLLLSEYSDSDSPLYLSESLREMIYRMGTTLKAKRTPRLTRGFFEPVRDAVLASQDSKVKAGLIDLLAHASHWHVYFREVDNLSHQYDDETYFAISDLRRESKELLLSFVDPSKDPADQVSGLNALCKLGEGDVADPVAELLASSDSDDVKIAAIRCLEWVRVEAGRAALQAAGLLDGDESMDVKLQAARSLAFVGDAQGLPLLIENLESDDLGQRELAVDSLRTVADRYLGYDPANPTPEAIDRWNRWYDSEAESLRIQLARIRDREFRYFNHTWHRELAIQEGLRKIIDSENPKDLHFNYKAFYAMQQEFLPGLIEAYDGVEGQNRALVSNLIVSRFDRRLSVPFIVELLKTETDTLALVGALDGITLLTQDSAGFTQAEADALMPLVRSVLQDTSRPHLVRIQAATTLGELGDPSGVPVLIDCLTVGPEVENSGWVCDEAFRALRRVRRLGGERQEFGYEPNAPQVVKEAAVQSFRDWWAQDGTSFKVEPDWK